MSKLAFVGEEKVGYLFRSFDFAMFPVKDSEEAIAKIKEIYKSKKFDVVITTEDFAEDLGKFMQEKTDVMPVIFVLPSLSRHEGLGIQWIRKSVEKAVGIDILSNKE
jgi:V/A-type H+-transporting ATPase subunit F